MDKNVYGSLISRLRQDNNMTTQELANILLITPEKMMRVEAGEAIQDVEEQYHNSEIILDADDLKETTIEAAHPQLDEEITTDLRGIFL